MVQPEVPGTHLLGRVVRLLTVYLCHAEEGHFFLCVCHIFAGATDPEEGNGCTAAGVKGECEPHMGAGS